MKPRHFSSALLLGSMLLAAGSAWAPPVASAADETAPAPSSESTSNTLVDACAAEAKKTHKNGAVDKYGGHCGRDGFYYDRFGGHYEEYGYEFKDGSYKSVCGERYDAKLKKIFETDGSERSVPPDLKRPKDQKDLMRATCMVAEMDREEELKKGAHTPAVAPTPSADAPEPVEVLDAAQALRSIQFASGSSKFHDDSGGQRSLQAVSAFLAQRPDITKLRIAGHTSNSGTDKSSLALSRRRALAIKDSLVKMGVAGERLVAVAFGHAMPIADNATAAGRALNERVEFQIAELDGQPQGDLYGGGAIVP